MAFFRQNNKGFSCRICVCGREYILEASVFTQTWQAWHRAWWKPKPFWNVGQAEYLRASQMALETYILVTESSPKHNTDTGWKECCKCEAPFPPDLLSPAHPDPLYHQLRCNTALWSHLSCSFATMPELSLPAPEQLQLCRYQTRVSCFHVPHLDLEKLFLER